MATIALQIAIMDLQIAANGFQIVIIGLHMDTTG